MQVIFIRKPNEPSYMEQFLTDDQSKIQEAIEWAEKGGYIYRIANIDLSTKPDFIGAIR